MLNIENFICLFTYSVATTTNTIQITLQMQIENPETSLTPPTPSSPLGRDAGSQSPEGIASLSSGSSDNAFGKYSKSYWFIYIDDEHINNTFSNWTIQIELVQYNRNDDGWISLHISFVIQFHRNAQLFMHRDFYFMQFSQNSFYQMVERFMIKSFGHSIK